MKNLMKNLILISVLALLTTQAQAASFEPLGPSRTLGDVYDDLMTASELNQYIDDQGMSDARVGAYYTAHKVNNPHELSDIINTSVLDVYSAGHNRYASWLTHVIIIKGDAYKYSFAQVSRSANSSGLYQNIHVFNDNRNYFHPLNDGTTRAGSRPLNISIKGSNAVQVPEPSILYLMLACLLPVGLKRLKKCI